MAREIFLSYRHSDATGFTEALYAYLQQSVGADHLFRDRQNIDYGYCIPGVVRQHIDGCIVLLAVIGRGWLTAADVAGRRRLDDPDDSVRVEIQSALDMGKRIIPVLVDSARMPEAIDLPKEITEFSTCKAVVLSSEQFALDCHNLASILKKAIEPYISNRLEPTDLRTSRISELRLRSDQGDADAQNELGLMHAIGVDTITVDHTEAVRLYRLAAAQGHVAAQFNLAGMYLAGQGVLQNPQETARLLHSLADQGFAPAQCYLARMYRSGMGVTKDLAKAVRYSQLAADQGYAPAQVDLGVMYSEGFGVKRNVAEAVRLYRLAAGQDNAAGQCSLAFCYESGRGVTKNESEAIRLYRLAADQGFHFALYELAKRYRDGTGVPKNTSEAKRLFQLAEEQGGLMGLVEAHADELQLIMDAPSQQDN